jgi:hypothetical protein
VGNSTYKPTLHRIKVHNAGTNIATGTNTVVTLGGTVDYNVGGDASGATLSTAGNQVTLKDTGLYHIIAHVLYNSPNPQTGGTYRQVFVTAGGSVRSNAIEGGGVSDFAAHATAHWIGELTKGDTVFMTTVQNTSGTIALTAQTCLMIQMLRRL